LGAMVFGSVPREWLQLNEEGLWAGSPFDVYPEHFAENLQILQQLVLNGKVVDIEWKNGRIRAVRIKSEAGGMCRVRCNDPVSIIGAGRRMNMRATEQGRLEFATEIGGVYDLLVRGGGANQGSFL